MPADFYLFLQEERKVDEATHWSFDNEVAYGSQKQSASEAKASITCINVPELEAGSGKSWR